MFGARAGHAMRSLDGTIGHKAPPKPRTAFARRSPSVNCAPSPGTLAGFSAADRSLQRRSSALQSRSLEPIDYPDRAAFELRNMHQVASLIARAALAREESRGGHYRTDFPCKSPLSKSTLDLLAAATWMLRSPSPDNALLPFQPACVHSLCSFWRQHHLGHASPWAALWTTPCILVASVADHLGRRIRAVLRRARIRAGHPGLDADAAGVCRGSGACLAAADRPAPR